MEGVASDFRVSLIKVASDVKYLQPLDLPEMTNKGLAAWLKSRTVPVHRAYVQSFLAKQGLSERDVAGIIRLSRGLSLTDSYWVASEHDETTFAEVNLFDNRFDTVLAGIAFTGYGSYAKSDFRSSPEFTTNGMLAKCWRRIKDEPVLFKAGSTGFVNAGREPYSEYYASQIASALGLYAVKYGLSRWKGAVCSTCEFFTSKDVSFVPIGSLVKTGGIKAVEQYYRDLGSAYFEEFADMIMFDALVCNVDRHFGNFGLLVDNGQNKIVGCAPIFDNGLSLFEHAMDDDLENLDDYAATRIPATYASLVGFAKEVMGKRQREKLRKLVSFRFQRHPRYHLPAHRMREIEKFITRRAQELLG